MTAPTQIRIDSEIKKKANELFSSIGLDMSTAVNLFLYQCVLRGGLPFKVEQPRYNDETIDAMAEAMRISRGPNAKGYASMDEFKKAIAEGGMPFDMKLDDSTRRALAAVRSMREASEANGNSEMTLEEVNDEIAKARREARSAHREP